ncbi:hypothetical protein M427DRAFT_32327 [Gonapodya prolifera JEL478]|uniref:E3 ubiquitin-protein ligase CHFR n=1 Tax=Gonapodya prolifera (strain JEL478) TaxID=1344416 RepID=A0A139AFK9_GONPJ|nr:hypothetical protein M427DRAFT_32327 [Gonapodya prolifera JEL478]|eukprot:KXS15354.1 hypothetical protein M427DRAFT_32327 [Gonapodya prolifera JEL478]
MALVLTLQPTGTRGNTIPTSIIFDPIKQFCSIRRDGATAATSPSTRDTCEFFNFEGNSADGDGTSEHDTVTALHFGRFEPGTPPTGFVYCGKATDHPRATNPSDCMPVFHAHQNPDAARPQGNPSGGSAEAPAALPVSDSAFFVHLFDDAISRNHCTIKAVPVHVLERKTARRASGAGGQGEVLGSSDEESDEDSEDAGPPRYTFDYFLIDNGSMNKTTLNRTFIHSRRETRPLRTGDTIGIGQGEPRCVVGTEIPPDLPRAGFVYSVVISGQGLPQQGGVGPSVSDILRSRRRYPIPVPPVPAQPAGPSPPTMLSDFAVPPIAPGIQTFAMPSGTRLDTMMQALGAMETLGATASSHQGPPRVATAYNRRVADNPVRVHRAPQRILRGPGREFTPQVGSSVVQDPLVTEGLFGYPNNPFDSEPSASENDDASDNEGTVVSNTPENRFRRAPGSQEVGEGGSNWGAAGRPGFRFGYVDAARADLDELASRQHKRRKINTTSERDLDLELNTLFGSSSESEHEVNTPQEAAPPPEIGSTLVATEFQGGQKKHKRRGRSGMMDAAREIARGVVSSAGLQVEPTGRAAVEVSAQTSTQSQGAGEGEPQEGSTLQSGRPLSSNGRKTVTFAGDVTVRDRRHPRMEDQRGTSASAGVSSGSLTSRKRRYTNLFDSDPEEEDEVMEDSQSDDDAMERRNLPVAEELIWRQDLETSRTSLRDARRMKNEQNATRMSASVSASLLDTARSGTTDAPMDGTEVPESPVRFFSEEPQCDDQAGTPMPDLDGNDVAPSSANVTGEKTAPPLATKTSPARPKNPLVDVLRTHMECIICCDWLVVPKFLPCGHGFCGPCIHPWLDRQQTCPSCRSKIQKDATGVFPLSENVSVRDMLTSMFIPELLKSGELDDEKMKERKQREDDWKAAEEQRAQQRTRTASRVHFVREPRQLLNLAGLFGPVGANPFSHLGEPGRLFAEAYNEGRAMAAGAVAGHHRAIRINGPRDTPGSGGSWTGRDPRNNGAAGDPASLRLRLRLGPHSAAPAASATEHMASTSDAMRARTREAQREARNVVHTTPRSVRRTYVSVAEEGDPDEEHAQLDSDPEAELVELEHRLERKRERRHAERNSVANVEALKSE